LDGYRDIPIYKTSMMKAAGVSPATHTGASAGGGDCAAHHYFTRVAAVTLTGEQVASPEVDTDATGNGGTGVLTLTWTAVTGAKLYKIYVGISTGVLYLLTTIAASQYDTTGAITTATIGFTWGTAAGSCPATKPGNTQALLPIPTSGDKPVAAGKESIMLINLQPDRGAELVSLISELGEPVDNLIRYIELATRKSAYEFVVESFAAMQTPWEILHAVTRNVSLT
jgi:hypothetical protein